MTFLLGCITTDRVYLASDRRLTDFAPPHRVATDEANKAIIVGGRVAFAYAGRSVIDKLSTDDWFAKTVAAGPCEDMHVVCDRVAQEAAEACSRLSVPLSDRRLAFMGVGWFRPPGAVQLQPGFLAIHNAYEAETDSWLPQSREAFAVGTKIGPELVRGSNIWGMGASLSQDEKGAIADLVCRCTEHRNAGPNAVLRAMVESMLWLADRRHSIGHGANFMTIPRAAAEIAEQSGEQRLLFGAPAPSSATCGYISAEGRVTVHGPTLVDHGVVLASPETGAL